MQDKKDNSPEKAYLSQLIKKNDNPESGDQEQVLKLITNGINKVQIELESGDLNIERKTKAQQQLVKLKKDKYKNQMELLNREIVKNDEMFRKAKRQIAKQKKEESELMKEENELKRREIVERVRKWTELQKQLKEKRQLLEGIRLKKQNQQDQRVRKEEEEQQAFQKLQKKKQIEQKLRAIEENKMKRQEIIKNSQNIYQQLNPKYIQIQKKFRQFEEEIQFEQDILKKNHKLSMKIDHQAIKMHDKNFMNKLQGRDHSKKRNQHSPKSADGSKGADFKQYLSRDQVKVNLQKQKLKRRKDFQQKIKQIPIVIDQTKKLKMEVAIDKGKNKMKYNFLGQKKLNDFQIFGQFNDFQINVNPKELGKQYLKELPTLTQGSRILKSSSLNALAQRSTSQRIVYKDYLQDMKMKRTSDKSIKTQQQIKTILKSHKQKSKIVQQLNQKSKKYELQARRKMQQLQKYNGFKSALKKSKQVDDMYLKSIKAKLACLQMTE